MCCIKIIKALFEMYSKPPATGSCCPIIVSSGVCAGSSLMNRSDSFVIIKIHLKCSWASSTSFPEAGLYNEIHKE